jgi:hypothetical protein
MRELLQRQRTNGTLPAPATSGARVKREMKREGPVNNDDDDDDSDDFEVVNQPPPKRRRVIATIDLTGD